MITDDKKLKVVIKKSQEEVRKLLMKQYWCFQQRAFDFKELNEKIITSVNSSKQWLSFMYGLFFIVVITKIALHSYLLREYYDDFSFGALAIVIVDLGFSGIWTIITIKVFVEKLRYSGDMSDISNHRNEPVYFQELNLSFYAAMTFILEYFILGLWSLLLLCDEHFDNYGLFLVVVYVAYGLLAESSPICALVNCVMVFWMFVGEAVFRAVACKLKSMCPKVKDCTETIILPLFPYEEGKFEEKRCNICLTDFKKDQLICPLKCHRMHVFHAECLKEWFVVSCCCPLCRAKP
eukprot:TRINITY_DN59_c0_g4_i1.p1 TRINITY_DN59_c0_g4~~TRINITY_DN59_c0_g4_i1.p1  ORF type:complete len:293 (-),score=58.41 TRINITY_DN59_c0_g4_i1:131-1009(-)